MSKVKIIDRRSEISIMSERNLLSNLHHPFIVNMYFAFQDFYNLYLVMDLLTGGDLRYHIAHKKTFTERETKFLIANMLLALKYIHSKNIIHRDIKPENLVLEKNGYVRITDFGVAKINEADNSSETSGTPGYMAPEVILVQNHTFVSDFFALGVIGYEFMLGYRPYLGRGRKEIKMLIISKQAKLRLEEVPDDWSQDAMDFINLLLQRKPKKRLGYNGVKEIMEHSWMKDIDWDKLYLKKIDAPFVPNMNKENFDKKYCEGEDEVGETTVERYELYFQSDLYEGVFQNYTYVNMDYMAKFQNKENQKVNELPTTNNEKKQQISRSNSKSNVAINSNKKILLYDENCNNQNKNPVQILEKDNSSQDKNPVQILNKNNNSQNNGKNQEIINDNNNVENKKKEKNSSVSINVVNGNSNKINNNSSNTKLKLKKNKNLFNTSKVTTNNGNKFDSTNLVNENIICNNYINLNFNNCSNLNNNANKNSKINVNTLNKLLSKSNSMKIIPEAQNTRPILINKTKEYETIQGNNNKNKLAKNISELNLKIDSYFLNQYSSKNKINKKSIFDISNSQRSNKIYKFQNENNKIMKWIHENFNSRSNNDNKFQSPKHLTHDIKNFNEINISKENNNNFPNINSNKKIKDPNNLNLNISSNIKLNNLYKMKNFNTANNPGKNLYKVNSMKYLRQNKNTIDINNYNNINTNSPPPISFNSFGANNGRKKMIKSLDKESKINLDRFKSKNFKLSPSVKFNANYKKFSKGLSMENLNVI